MAEKKKKGDVRIFVEMEYTLARNFIDKESQWEPGIGTLKYEKNHWKTLLRDTGGKGIWLHVEKEEL